MCNCNKCTNKCCLSIDENDKKCGRCGGLMVYKKESFLYLFFLSTPHMYRYVCTRCGCIEEY